MNFLNKTVIVTGAGGGVGRKITELFATAGARVVCVDYNQDSLDKLAAELNVLTVRADISDPEDVRLAVAAAGERVDVLINNAGVIDRLGNVAEATIEEWDRVIGINLTGPFLFCNAVVPGMLANGGGVIVNVASAAGLRGGRAGAAYTASKFGVVGLTMNIAATLGQQGIRCNAVCPGSILTSMGEAPGVLDSARHNLSRDRDKPPAALPEEVAQVIFFLASEEACRINGVAMPVDSGWVSF